MEDKKNRRLRVYGQSNGYNYEDVPTIVLKGKWLETAGFKIQDRLQIVVEQEKIIIKKVK